MAIGMPTTITAVQVTKMTFMNVGGSVGPGGTRSKFGPLIHRIHTYNWKARIAPPTVAQMWMGLTFGCTWAPIAAAPPSGSVIEGVLFLSDSPLLMTLSPHRSLRVCNSTFQLPGSKGTTVGTSAPSGRTSSPSVLMKPECFVGIGRAGSGQGTSVPSPQMPPVKYERFM